MFDIFNYVKSLNIKLISIARFIDSFGSVMNTYAKRKLEIDGNTTDNNVDIGTQIDFSYKNIKIRPKKKSKLVEQLDADDHSDYYVENGLRKVYPYYFTYSSFCKGRWVGRTLTDFYCQEFRAMARERLITNIRAGFLLVNNKKVDEEYKLKNNDLITHRLHRHELPILAAPIPIVFISDEMLVVDKPPSIPVHPCGRYRYNSLLYILKREHNLENLHTIHRLDRLTSGILLIARTNAMSQKLHKEILNKTIMKEYICRVEGNFPDGTITCDQPLETISWRIGICIASPNGKLCTTIFEKINFNGKTSTVLCKPLTGRMHQIRVHLQYLGHPIVNDSFYNNYAFGPTKGKNGEYGKDKEKLLVDLEAEYIKNKSRADNCESREIALRALNHYTSQESWKSHKSKYDFDKDKLTTESDCEQCFSDCSDPEPKDLLIYLHAIRYKGTDWNFETQLPVWARDDWID